MIFLHKILPLLVSPLFLILVLAVWGALIRSKTVNLVAVGILIVCSLPVVSNQLITALEQGYTLAPAASAKEADAVVVLSGMVRTIEGEDGLAYEWAEAADRIFAGIDLIKNDKSSVLILTGGKLPWSVGKPEGGHLREIAEELGVPAGSILVTENVQNTDQEAKAVAKLLSKDHPTVILVTSAFHMPRAQTVFEAAGIVVSPFAVDFLTDADKTKAMDFIPSAEAFRESSFFVREIIGRLYYTLKY